MKVLFKGTSFIAHVITVQVYMHIIVSMCLSGWSHTNYSMSWYVWRPNHVLFVAQCPYYECISTFVMALVLERTHNPSAQMMLKLLFTVRISATVSDMIWKVTTLSSFLLFLLLFSRFPLLSSSSRFVHQPPPPLVLSITITHKSPFLVLVPFFFLFISSVCPSGVSSVENKSDCLFIDVKK